MSEVTYRIGDEVFVCTLALKCTIAYAVYKGRYMVRYECDVPKYIEVDEEDLQLLIDPEQRGSYGEAQEVLQESTPEVRQETQGSEAQQYQQSNISQSSSQTDNRRSTGGNLVRRIMSDNFRCVYGGG